MVKNDFDGHHFLWRPLLWNLTVDWCCCFQWWSFEDSIAERLDGLLRPNTPTLKTSQNAHIPKSYSVFNKNIVCHLEYSKTWKRQSHSSNKFLGEKQDSVLRVQPIINAWNTEPDKWGPGGWSKESLMSVSCLIGLMRQSDSQGGEESRGE